MQTSSQRRINVTSKSPVGDTSDVTLITYAVFIEDTGNVKSSLLLDIVVHPYLPDLADHRVNCPGQLGQQH